LAYAQAHGASWRLALLLGVIAEGLLIGLFDTPIHIVWPEPLVLMLIQ
jgi:hypothetical protein